MGRYPISLASTAITKKPLFGIAIAIAKGSVNGPLEHMTLSKTDRISFVCALLKKVFGKVSFRRELTIEQLFPSHFAPCNLTATLCVYEVLYECTFRSI